MAGEQRDSGRAEGDGRRRFGPVQWFLTIVSVGLLAMWALIFYRSWTGGYEYTDGVPDRAWVADAERVCAAAKPAIAALPQAVEFKDLTPADRAPSVVQATDLLEELVADLRALPVPQDAKSQDLTSQWLGSWDVYLADRRVHEAKLAANEDARFTETAAETGVPNTLRMDDFARRNGMPACQTLGDLA